VPPPHNNLSTEIYLNVLLESEIWIFQI